MRRAAQHYSTREAIVYNDQRLTFAEAWARGVKLANALLAMGLQPGDRVGVLEDNSVQAADFFQAAAIANLVRVPLYPRNGRSAHLHMLGHTDCRAVLVSAVHAHEIQEIGADLPGLEHVVVRDDSYEEWLAQQSDVDPDVTIEPDNYFIIRHTGGTTRGYQRASLTLTKLGLPLGVIGFTPSRRLNLVTSACTWVQFHMAPDTSTCRSGWLGDATSWWITLRQVKPWR